MNQRQSFTFPQSSFQFGPNITSLSLRPTPQPLPTPVSPAATDDGSTAVATPRSQLCGQCQSAGGRSVSYCSKCCCFLCKPCTDSHKRMATFKSHEIVPPEQTDTTSNCPKHSSEFLTTYCMTCKCLICQDCELFSHYGHETKSVSSARESIKAHLKLDFECLLKHLKSFQSHSQKIAKVGEHIASYPHKLRGFISENVKDTEHKDKLLNEVDTHYSQYSKALYTEKESVSKAIGMLESEIKSANQLMKNSKLLSLEFAVCAYESMSSMKKLKLLAWNPNILSMYMLLVCVRNTNDKQSLPAQLPPAFGATGKSSPLKSTGSDNDILLVKSYYATFKVDKSDLLIGMFTGFKALTAVFSWSGTAVSRNASSELLFPELSISCDVIGSSTLAVPCTITRNKSTCAEYNSWKISYKEEGPCSVKATLQLNGDIYCQAEYNDSQLKINI